MTLPLYPPSDTVPDILVPSGQQRQPEPLDRVLWLPCTLVVEASVIAFSVRTLMNLSVGEIVETSCEHNDDLPLVANGQIVGLTEFEVVGERLAVRLTSMA